MFDRARHSLETPYGPTLTSSEAHTSLLHTSEHATIDKKLAKRLEKASKRRNRLPLKIAALALATTSVTNAYWSDVEANRATESELEISIEVISEPQNEANADHATVIIDGFNAYDANYLTNSLGPSIQEISDGELWSLNYNNAILDREEIYEKIIELAEERDIDSISIAGYSMGGIIGTEAAADIVQKSDLPVHSLMLISTPDGYDGLRPYQREELAFGQWLADAIPGSIYSSWARTAGEVYFYRNAYTEGELEAWNIPQNFEVIRKNISEFIGVLGTVMERAESPRQTSMQLLTQQIYKIAKADILHEFKTIQEQGGTKQLPAIVYFGTAEPGYDYIVDDKISADNVCRYAEETGLSCEVFRVAGAIHSRYYETLEAYQETFLAAEPVVRRDIELQIAALALKNDVLISEASAQNAE